MFPLVTTAVHQSQLLGEHTTAFSVSSDSSQLGVPALLWRWKVANDHQRLRVAELSAVITFDFSLFIVLRRGARFNDAIDASVRPDSTG